MKHRNAWELLSDTQCHSTSCQLQQSEILGQHSDLTATPLRNNKMQAFDCMYSYIHSNQHPPFCVYTLCVGLALREANEIFSKLTWSYNLRIE